MSAPTMPKAGCIQLKGMNCTSTSSKMTSPQPMATAEYQAQARRSQSPAKVTNGHTPSTSSRHRPGTR